MNSLTGREGGRERDRERHGDANYTSERRDLRESEREGKRDRGTTHILGSGEKERGYVQSESK